MRHCSPVIPWIFILCFSGVSCSVQDMPVEDRVCVSFEACAPPPFTKSRLSDREYVVETLDLFVFDARSGERVALAHGTSPRVSVLVPVRTSLKYAAIVNGCPGVNFDNREQFLSTRAEFSSFGTSSFMMISEGEASFEDSASVPLHARRMLCKVMVDSVSLKIATPVQAVLSKAYLINVCGSEPYSMAASDVGPWFNRMALDTSLPSALKEHLTSGDLSLSLSEAPARCGVALYCLPNPLDNNLTSRELPIWSPRPTRLVLEVLMDGAPHYYPITFVNMKSNACYRIRHLVLTGSGSSDPDDPEGGRSAEYEVSVTEWGERAAEVIGL